MHKNIYCVRFTIQDYYTKWNQFRNCTNYSTFGTEILRSSRTTNDATIFQRSFKNVLSVE